MSSVFLLLTVAGCSQQSVTKLKTPPEVAIETPVDGSELDEGVPIAMRGRVIDESYSDSLEQVIATWAVDGAVACAESTFTSAGISDCTTIFDDGDTTVTLTATDPDGQTATATTHLVIRVNNAPTAQIIEPTSDGAYYSSSITAFEGKVGDGEDSPEELTVEWKSSIDDVLPLDTAPTSDGTISGSTSLSPGEHLITLTVTDSTGRTGQDTVTINVEVGTRPELELLTPMSGDVVNEGEYVHFSAVTTDDRTDPIDMVFSWESSIDGVFSTQGASSDGTVDFVDDGLSHGAHTITVSATDTDGMTAKDSATLIVNGIPTAPEVSISPDPAGSGDNLTVGLDVPASDPDGDTLTYSYAWYVNGVVSAYTSNPLPASATTRGEVWTVYVAASDGYASGPTGSASVSIGNGPPSLSGVTIDPTVAYTNDTLTAVPSGYSDPDGDPAGYHYQWSVDGTSIPGATDPTLAGTYFSRDQSVVVTVWPFDGVDEGTPVSSGARVISNSAPTAPVVVVTPEKPEPGVDLSCNVTTASVDLDGDAITYAYSWTNDGSATSVTTSTVAGSYTSAGEVWACFVVPNDGTVDGTAGSDSVEVNDYTAPDAPVLTGLDPYRNETTAVIYGTSEAFATITLYEVSDSGTVTTSATANGAGSFTFTRTLKVGGTYQWYATATDSNGNTSGVSNTIGTEVCDPGDDYEDSSGYGDTCGDPIVEWATLSDAGTKVIEIDGNLLDATDEDWIQITTSDLKTAGINYYRFHVELESGASDYAFAVYDGGCTDSYLDCGSGSYEDPEGDGYTEYEVYQKDQGDGGHAIPSDTRTCYEGSVADYNVCDDFASTYTIHVLRTSSGFDCTGYRLRITNGEW